MRCPLICALLLGAPLAVPAPSCGAPAQRVGVADGPAFDPQQQTKKVKLGTSTRNAIEVSAESSFQIVAPGRDTRLLFSIGAQGLETSSGIEFRIRAGAGDQWQTVFSATVAPGQDGWADHSVDLSALAPTPERIRFETVAQGTAPAGTAHGYWGSLVVLRSHEHAARAPVSPNVILLSLDTLGADQLTSFGNIAGVSPRIDALLDHSYSFRRAYAQYPNTLVSHASLLSGLYPLHHGVYGGVKHSQLRSATLADVLAERGYLTVAITENAYVSSDFGFDQGFDWYDNGLMLSEDFPGDALGTFAKATAWLDQYGGRAPFFLFVHTYEVHTPYRPRDDEARRIVAKIDPGYQGPFADHYPGRKVEVDHNAHIELIGARDLRHLAALQAGEIEYLDRIVAQFTTHVAALPFAGDTLLVITADHGDEFGEHGKVGHGETLYNQVLHVPLGFYWPGRITPGRNETPVQLVDVMPTILELIGVDRPSDLDGRSLAAVLRAPSGGIPARPVFAELRTAWGTCYELRLAEDCAVERYAVQTERFKLITSMIPYYEQLFDLANDAGETRDVAAEFPAEMAQLRALLVDYVIGVTPSGAATVPSQQRGSVQAPTPAPTLDDATRERLKALGYNP